MLQLFCFRQRATMQVVVFLLTSFLPIASGEEIDFITSGTTDTCTSHSTCTDCNANRWCHWCGDSKGCHVMGSVYGCARGLSCHNKTDDSCGAHKTCSECALASRLCHWCAFDASCHVLGSPSGCLHGVDCYDNDHCMRKEPEELPPKSLEVTPIPVAIATVLALLICCCATCCCCAVAFVKDTYNDLVDDIHASRSRSPMSPARTERNETTELLNSGEDDTAIDSALDVNANVDSSEENKNHLQDGEEGEVETGESEPLVYSRRRETTSDYTLLEDDVEERFRRPGRSIHRLYNACVCCYLFTLAAAAFLAYGTVKYFPEKPTFSVCNDSVAWKSIIDSIAAGGVGAHFELLVSLENPNPVDVVLDMCKGSFYHGDSFVGSFEIPGTTVAANAISDLMIIAEFSPEKWLAVQIGTEYYRGVLKLDVKADATVRVPILMGYTFTAGVDDFVVDVNAAADRHLCACPTWSDARNHSTPVPRFMEDFEL